MLIRLDGEQAARSGIRIIIVEHIVFRGEVEKEFLADVHL